MALRLQTHIHVVMVTNTYRNLSTHLLPQGTEHHYYYCCELTVTEVLLLNVSLLWYCRPPCAGGRYCVGHREGATKPAVSSTRYQVMVCCTDLQVGNELL